MWSFEKKREYYQNLLAELEAMLIEKGITPVHLFREPKILSYLVYYPLHHIYCFLRQTNIDKFINRKEREFAHFIRKVGIIRRKKINLLLDSPGDYDYEYPASIGWKPNPRFDEEMKNYRKRLADYEAQQLQLAEKREELLRQPEAGIFRLVMKEYDAAKCSTCAGTGLIPSLRTTSCDCCFKCKGTGKSGYIPDVTAEQARVAKEFKAKLDSLKVPTFSAFPRKKKSVYIRVVHGGQIFITER